MHHSNPRVVDMATLLPSNNLITATLHLQPLLLLCQAMEELAHRALMEGTILLMVIPGWVGLMLLVGMGAGIGRDHLMMAVVAEAEVVAVDQGGLDLQQCG